MPGRLEYDEAMLFSAIRLKIQDPELKQGQVEMISAQTARGTIPRPWGIEGGFAVVYKFRKKSGALCALRCFRVPVQPDTQFRYERIGPYFHTHARAITAGFRYHDAAITIIEQGKQQKQSYPIIEMDWVDGVTLVEKVDELCKLRQQAVLKTLAEQWLALLTTMRQAQIAHGDLAGVNVMVHPDGRLVLIDYDGIYIPEFAGLAPVLVGQEDFQHPQMNQRGFHEHIDAFSGLVIYIALVALTMKPELWERYAKFNATGQLVDFNLLFRKQDFLDPQQSPLFNELAQLGDAHLQALTRELQRMCSQPINDVQFPFALVDPQYQQKLALASLTSALQSKDDVQIAASWLPILEQYAPAQVHRSRVQLAQRRLGALRTFRDALASGDLQRIIDDYDASQLDTSGSLSNEERALLPLAHAFLQAYAARSDDTVTIAERIANTINSITIVFTPQQQQLLTEIRQRQQAQQTLATAFQSREVGQIAATLPLLGYATTPLARTRIERAATFMQSYRASDDRAFLASYQALRQDPDPDFFVLTSDQQRRAALIQQHDEVLLQFRQALASRSPWRVARSYDPLLDTSTALTPTEREQLALARQLTTALRNGDYRQLLAAESTLQHSPQRAFFLLTAEEMRRFTLAHEQQQAHLTFRAALQNRRPAEIVAAYSPVLDMLQALTTEEREQLDAARLFVQVWLSNDDEAIVRMMQDVQGPGARYAWQTMPQEQQRYALAQRRIAAVDTLRRVLRSAPQDAQQIIDAYDASLLDNSTALLADERDQVAAALQYQAMYEALQNGLRADNDDLIRHAFDPALAQRFSGITIHEQQRIDKAMITQQLEDLLDGGAYDQAIQMARSLQIAGAYTVAPSLIFKLKRAVMRFIRDYDLSQLSVQIDTYNNINYATVSWQWPQHPLIQVGLLAWSTRAWPERPSDRHLNDPNWQHIWLMRKNNVFYDRQTFPIGQERQIYVRSYAAILDTWDRSERWRFSDGREPTSSTWTTNSHLMQRRP